MRKLFAIAVCGLLILGCGQNARVDSINERNEILEEASFRIEYPQGWKILSEADYSNPKETKVAYHLRHPRNKLCQVTIEIWTRPASSAQADSQIKQLIASKIRSLKEVYGNSGYGDFSFQTSSATLAGQQATKLKVNGAASNLTRETVVIFLYHQGNFYIVSHDWLSDWNPQARARLTETIRSLRFLR